MKKRDLLLKLQQYPDDIDVCITDLRKNIFYTDNEPQGEGIVPDFKVELVDVNVNTPFLALIFENDEYDEEGVRYV